MRKANFSSPSPLPLLLLLLPVIIAIASCAQHAFAHDEPHDPTAAVVMSMGPVHVGMAGGSLLTIKGHGFERRGVEGRTVVYVGVQVCRTIEYYSSDTQIVCLTPPALTEAEADEPVSIALVSFASASYAIFDSVDNTLYYRWSHTPILRSASLSASPGGLIEVSGELRACKASELTVKLGTGSRPSVMFNCILTADPDHEINPAGSASWNSYGTTCTAPEMAAGRYNLTVNAHSPPDYAWGDAWPAWAAWHAAGGQAYHLTVVPRVSGMSTAATGTLGGQLLRITGTGFDSGENCTRNRVWVAGAAAEVRSCSATELEVVVPPKPAVQAIAGSRGLSLKFYGSVSFGSFETAMAELAAANDEPEMHVTQSEAAAGRVAGDQDLYFQLLEAWLVPPVTANYSFYVLGDDRASVELGTTDSPDSLVQVAETHWSSTYWEYPEQISRPIALVAGQRYAFRVRHQEGWGSDYVHVAMRIHNSPHQTPADRAFQSLSERQVKQSNDDEEEEEKEEERKGNEKAALC